MTSLADMLKRAIATATASHGATASVEPSIQGYSAPSLSNMVPQSLQEAYGGAVKTLIGMLEDLVKNPTPEKARSFMDYLVSLKNRIGASRFYGLVSQLRGYLAGSPYLQLLEKALAGNTSEVYKYAQAIHRAQIVKRLVEKTGLPRNIILELLDDKGRVSAEKLAEMISSRINALTGRGAYMTYQELAKLTGDIRVLLRLGVASLGKDKVREILSGMLRGRPKAEAVQLRKVIAYVEKGDVKALASLLKGKATITGAKGLSQTLRSKAYQAQGIPAGTQQANTQQAGTGEKTEQQRFATQMTNIMKTLGK